MNVLRNVNGASFEENKDIEFYNDEQFLLNQSSKKKVKMFENFQFCSWKNYVEFKDQSVE